MKKIRFFYFFCLVLTIIWCCVIFLFSAQDAVNSTALSNRVLNRILDILTACIPAEAIDEVEADSFSVVFFTRKIAHFTLYFILGLFSSATMLFSGILHKRKPHLCWFIAWLFCIFYAITDEIHQLFVPGRTGRLLDIGIDSSGALLGSLFLLFFFQRAWKRHISQKGV